MEKKAQLGSTKTRHEEVREVPGDKVSSEIDEAWVRAGDENVSGCDSVMAMRARRIFSSPRTKMIRVVGMKSMSGDKLETRRLKVAGAPEEASLGKVRECVSSGLGKNRVVQVRL